MLDDRGIDRAVLAGASMGAHTAVRFALDAPERVAGLVVATPAFDPEEDRDAGLARWDALSEGLRTGGVEGFVEAYGDPQRARAVEGDDRQRTAPAHRRARAPRGGRRRAARGAALAAVRDVGRARRRSTCRRSSSPSRDEADPGHPYAVGEAYAERIPGAELRVGGARQLAAGLAGRAALEGDQRAGASERAQPAHDQQRRLHDQVAVVGGGELVVAVLGLAGDEAGGEAGAERGDRPGAAQRVVGLQRAGADAHLAELGRRAERVRRTRASRPARAARRPARAGRGCSSGNAASTTAVSPSASAWRMISPAVRVGQLARADRRALPVRHAAERRVAGGVAARGGQAQLPPGLGERAGQRGGLAEQEALAELGAERARGGELLLGVDALGEHERLAVLALGADRADDPRDVLRARAPAGGAGRA